MTDSSADVLRLVRRALDDFDVIPLDATVRRVIRIANLQGDSVLALRLSFDVSPHGGSRTANQATVRRLMADENLFGAPDSDVEIALEQYLDDRPVEEGTDMRWAHSVNSLIEIATQVLDPELFSRETRRQQIVTGGKAQRILDLIRYRCYGALCQWERQLSFAATNESILQAYQRRLDDFRGEHAPELLVRFNVVYRRLRDAEDADADAVAPEELAQAVTTCRRILKAVVDIVQPADPAQAVDDEGASLTDDKYHNRLAAYIRSHADSRRVQASTVTALDALVQRFKAVDGLASRGVHARTAAAEANFCALNTYLVAAEVVRVWQATDVLPA